MAARKRATSTNADAISPTPNSTGTGENQPAQRRWEITYPNGATEIVFQQAAAVRAQAEHGGSVRELT